jgi:hypothetical protein
MGVRRPEHDALCPASDFGTRCYCALIHKVVDREHDSAVHTAAELVDKAWAALKTKVEALPRHWSLDEDRAEPMFIYGVLLRDVRGLLGGDTS